MRCNSARSFRHRRERVHRETAGAKEARANVLQFVKAPLHHVADRYDAGSRLSSTTGKCRNFAAVVRAIIPITVSFMPQVAT